MSIPEEINWRQEIDKLHDRTGQFNVMNYLHVLSEDERKALQKVLAKVPQDNKIYI